MRPYLNKVWVADFDGLCSGEFLVLANPEGLNSRFLAARLNAQDFVTFANERVSGERPRVNFEKLAAFPILLPPSAEQGRIIAKLDAALSRIERANAAARRAQERLQRYRAAVLLAAVTGELTHAWRQTRRTGSKGESETGQVLLQRLLDFRREAWQKAEIRRLRATGKPPTNEKWKSRYREPAPPSADTLPKLPVGWTWASIDQLSWAAGYGTSVKCVYGAGGPPVLRIPNVRNRGLDFEDIKSATSFEGFRAEDFVTPGDLLVVRTNGSIDLVGRAALVRTFPKEKSSFASYLIRFRLVGDETVWSWVSLAWDSSIVRRSVESRAKTTAGQYNVSVSGLADLAIPLPPTDEQAEIVRQVDHRLAAADKLTSRLEQQLERSQTTRQLLLRQGLFGHLIPQDPNDEPASLLLGRIRAEKARAGAERKHVRGEFGATKLKGVGRMPEPSPRPPKLLKVAWERVGRKADARRLFDEAGFGPDHVSQFYEALRATPDVRAAFEKAVPRTIEREKLIRHAREEDEQRTGCFRLTELWLEDFKNLKDYTVRFDPTQGLDVVLGWNGTGKSNLFEALVIIFRDLHEWWEKNHWPDKPMNAYRLTYEMHERMVEISWRPAQMKRPELKAGPIAQETKDQLKLEPIKREQLPLPRFIFGYYSGPTNRLAEHFLPMKQAHYDRLREAKADDAKTLAKLLEQRRFFCAETHHAKYVLLAFSYKEDPKISEFLQNRLRIVGFESALFVIRKPRWAKPGSKAEDFWGATGIMRRVMERLRRHAIAPMVLPQKVRYGYRSTTEDHYYFFLPDLKSLHSFAAEYQDARTFFLALESTDFSELIHDVEIQVRIKSTNTEDATITFHQLSEGEQQLLMVLGLMRFTKSHQSLVLLDEPDTHLNPHWSVDYLKDLTRVMSDNALQSTEQQTSQILMATHDPLVIASLVKEQIHLLKRDSQSGACVWMPATVNPRGLGFTGILTSEMFGFRSDLDPETLADLDNRVRLVAKGTVLTDQEQEELRKIDKRLSDAGFSKAFSDPYYAAFVRAWGRRHSELMAGQRFLTPEKRREIDQIAQEVLKEAIAEVEKEIKE
jgi:restriction endonuclease S subunit/ABC-type cobalamin/Fe3+-siderophores transport system ATPase subunit